MALSSDSSDDENAALMKEAVDSTFFTDDMYTEIDKKDKKANVVKQKSQRFLENEEIHCDVRVSSDMQNRVGKKVSEIIEKRIKFVDIQPAEKPDRAVEGGIRLFSDSVDFVNEELPEEVLLSKEKRKKIKKRKLAEELLEDSKKVDLKSIVVSAEDVLENQEMEHWSSRQKPKVFKYKSKKDRKTLISLDDE